MRKRILLALLVMTISTFGLPVMAAADTAGTGASSATLAAEALNGYGLFLGVGADPDNPDFALSGAATRIQGLVMLVRLMGAEDAALSGNHPMPFDDVPAWAAPYVAYAFAEGWTKGVSDTTFEPNAEVSAAQYLTFVLRTLGYDDSAGNFSWDSAWTLTDSLGITDGEYSASSNSLDRGDMAVVSLVALTTPMNGTGQTLLARLAEEGVFERLAEEGLIKDEALLAAIESGSVEDISKVVTETVATSVATVKEAVGAEKAAAAAAAANSTASNQQQVTESTGPGSETERNTNNTSSRDRNSNSSRSSSSVAVTNVTLNIPGMEYAQLELYAGQTAFEAAYKDQRIEIRASVAPSGASNKRVRWSIDDDNETSGKYALYTTKTGDTQVERDAPTSVTTVWLEVTGVLKTGDGAWINVWSEDRNHADFCRIEVRETTKALTWIAGQVVNVAGGATPGAASNVAVTVQNHVENLRVDDDYGDIGYTVDPWTGSTAKLFTDSGFMTEVDKIELQVGVPVSAYIAIYDRFGDAVYYAASVTRADESSKQLTGLFGKPLNPLPAATGTKESPVLVKVTAPYDQNALSNWWDITVTGQYPLTYDKETFAEDDWNSDIPLRFDAATTAYVAVEAVDGTMAYYKIEVTRALPPLNDVSLHLELQPDGTLSLSEVHSDKDAHPHLGYPYEYWDGDDQVSWDFGTVTYTWYANRVEQPALAGNTKLTAQEVDGLLGKAVSVKVTAANYVGELTSDNRITPYKLTITPDGEPGDDAKFGFYVHGESSDAWTAYIGIDLQADWMPWAQIHITYGENGNGEDSNRVSFNVDMDDGYLEAFTASDGEWFTYALDLADAANGVVAIEAIFSHVSSAAFGVIEWFTWNDPAPSVSMYNATEDSWNLNLARGTDFSFLPAGAIGLKRGAKATGDAAYEKVRDISPRAGADIFPGALVAYKLMTNGVSIETITASVTSAALSMSTRTVLRDGTASVQLDNDAVIFSYDADGFISGVATVGELDLDKTKTAALGAYVLNSKGDKVLAMLVPDAWVGRSDPVVFGVMNDWSTVRPNGVNVKELNLLIDGKPQVLYTTTAFDDIDNYKGDAALAFHLNAHGDVRTIEAISNYDSGMVKAENAAAIELLITEMKINAGGQWYNVARNVVVYENDHGVFISGAFSHVQSAIAAALGTGDDVSVWLYDTDGDNQVDILIWKVIED